LLDHYEASAGWKVNFDKNLFFYNIRVRLQHRVARILKCSIKELLTTYLGMPLFKGNMKEVLWDLMIEYFSRKMVGWKGVLLSQGEKLQLIKLVL